MNLNFKIENVYYVTQVYRGISKDFPSYKLWENHTGTQTHTLRRTNYITI